MLYDFEFCNPTKIYFGKNSLAKLNQELNNYGSNILLVYGGGSIKKYGLYDKVIKILKDRNKHVYECAGVMPNPTLNKMLEGARMAKEYNIDLILAIGGGSVIDCAKAISVSAYAAYTQVLKPWSFNSCVASGVESAFVSLPIPVENVIGSPIA